MIVAITGSNGFVGKKLVQALKEGNDEIVGIDILSGTDITNNKDCERLPPFDVMVHLAAKIFVPDSYKVPGEFYFTNYIGTLNMLELCRKNNARFIFASSYVYGIPKYLPIDEGHPVNAFNPYADSKIQGEYLCKSYNKFFNVKTVIVRPTNIYGKGQSDNFLISSIINQAKTGKIILQDSKPRRDYIYIDDVVSAYLKIIYSCDLDFEIFNIGHGLSYSIKEITDTVNSLFDNKLDIYFSELERPNEVPDTKADISKAKRILAWEPKVSLIDGIKKCLYE
jgi:nucleoside-diphosphate-sugar epimerase